MEAEEPQVCIVKRDEQQDARPDGRCDMWPVALPRFKD